MHLRPYEIGIFEEAVVEVPDFVPIKLNIGINIREENSSMCYGLREYEDDLDSEDGYESDQDDSDEAGEFDE